MIWFLITFCCTHRFLSYAVTIREASSGNRWKQVHNPTEKHEENLNWRFPMSPSTWRWGTPREKNGKKDCMEDTRRTWPTESINKRYLGWQIVKQQGWVLQECVPCPVHICYDWWFGGFVILLTVGAGLSNSFACFWDSFSPIWWPFPTSIWGLLTCLIVPCFAHFYCYPLEACPFSDEEIGGVYLEEREDGSGLEEWR